MDDFSKNLPVWTKQPYETDAEFVSFQAYRDAKPPRRLVGRPGAGSTAELSRMFRENNWTIRVQAYDLYMDHVFLTEKEEFLKQSARDLSAQHMAILHTSRQLVQRELDKMLEASTRSDAVGLLSGGQITAMMDATVKLDRLIKGESTESVEVKQDLSALSVDELKQLRELTKKMSKT